MTRHQYGISALVSKMSFRRQTSDGVAEYRLFSLASSGQAKEILDFRFQRGNQGKGSLSGESFRPEGVVLYARSEHRKLTFRPLAYSLAVVS